MGNWYNILVAVDAMESSLSAAHYLGRVTGNIEVNGEKIIGRRRKFA